MAEQAAVNREVVSSTLTGAAIYWEVGKQAKRSRRWFVEPVITGSSPARHP